MVDYRVNLNVQFQATTTATTKQAAVPGKFSIDLLGYSSDAGSPRAPYLNLLRAGSIKLA